MRYTDPTVAVSGDIPSVISPVLRAAAEKIGGVGIVRNGNTIGCCSEFHAANKVMLRNPGTTPKDVIISPALRPRNDATITPCQNCIDIFGLIPKPK